MINYWKRFGAWVTELKTDPFVRARIKLTLQKFLIVLILFVVCGVILNYAYDYQISTHLAGRLPNKTIEKQIIEETASALRHDAFILLTILGGSVIFIGYYLAGATLVPIKQIVKAQKRFIADASHELRTPLSIMKTNAEVVLMDGENINPKETIDVLKSNIEEIDRMSKLIENLLRLSYYDSKEHDIQFSRLDLSGIVNFIMAKAKVLARQKSIRLIAGEIEPATIMGNETSLDQLVTNLMKNAILYTPEGGTVAVSVKRNKTGSVRFNVKDTGVGIDSNELPHIFDPFYKTSATRELYSGGSGLGLTIVKRIVDRHHAAIKVESGLGEGTSISVVFPSPDRIDLKTSVTYPVTIISS